MALFRGGDGTDPVSGLPGTYEEHKAERTRRLGTGTLACPACDAPVAPAAGGMAPGDPLACPFCLRSGPVREFLSLSAPARPARVAVRVLPRA